MRNFAKIRKLKLFGPESPNLGIWTRSLKIKSWQQIVDFPNFEILGGFGSFRNFSGSFRLVLGGFGWFRLISACFDRFRVVFAHSGFQKVRTFHQFPFLCISGENLSCSRTKRYINTWLPLLLLYCYFNHWTILLLLNSRAGQISQPCSDPSQTSKMELFAKIVNGFQSFGSCWLGS